MRFRKWLVSVFLFTAAVMATDLGTVMVPAAGNPNGPNGATDASRSQATIVAWTDANPNATPSVGDTMTGYFNDAWSQQFEVRTIVEGRIQEMRAVPGTLVNNGGASASEVDYTDQAGQCGGNYEAQYEHWEVKSSDGVTTSGWQLTQLSYVPNC
jgi:hypothetical protein